MEVDWVTGQVSRFKESRIVTSLIGGIIGQYCCCNGDTWSSELGILSNEEPHLTFKPVRTVTNGGMTKAGLLAVAAVGSAIGFTFVVLGVFTTNCTSDVTVNQLLVVPLSALAGVCGSVIDSLLGATLQFSGFCSIRKVVGKPGPTVKRVSGLTVLDKLYSQKLLYIRIMLGRLIVAVQYMVATIFRTVLPAVNSFTMMVILSDACSSHCL